MQISQAATDIIKTIIIWSAIITFFVVIPINFHIKIGKGNTGLIEFQIGKKENSIKIGNVDSNNY